MFGLHPFAAQSFGEGAPFVDALTTTNAITSAISSAVTESRIITTTAGVISSTSQTLPDNSITVLIPQASSVLSGALEFTIQDSSIFTYNDVSDSVGETWSNVVTTSSSESWSDV